MSDPKPISKTDMDLIRDRIVECQEVAHSIRNKSFEINRRAIIKEAEKDTAVDPGDVGQELKSKLVGLRDLLDDSFTTLSAFV